MKKNLQNIILIGFFLITLYFLGKHSLLPDGGSVAAISDGLAQQNTGLYQPVITLDLGKVEVRDYQKMGFTRGYVKFSPNSKHLAAGTETGDLYMLDTQGRVLWRKNAGVGRLSAMEFSPDNKWLYVGEVSPDGNIYCFGVEDGKEQWRRSSAVDIGVDIKKKSYPGIMRIVCDAQGFVYAVSQRRYRESDGLSLYNSKIISLSVQGSERWVFPRQGVMDAWVNWLSVDMQGRHLVFGTANFETRKQHEYDNNLYRLDGKNGLLAWTEKIDPVSPYNRTIMRGSPNLSADGKYLAAMTSDGRAFLYSTEGKKEWEYALCLPKEINGVYVNAVGRDGYVIGNNAIFATINTYNNANWQLPTPVEHPSSNSVFIFDVQGRFAGKWQAGGSVEELAYNDKLIAIGVGRNTKSKNAAVHGLTIISLPDAKLIDHISTTGPCMAVDISKDGSQAACIETPLKLDNGQIIGRYQLIILAKRKGE